MPQLKRRVVKIGGSLLEFPNWIEETDRWLTAQTPALSMLIVGGGWIVREIAEEQRAEGLDDKTIHWRCIREMHGHGRALVDLMPRYEWIKRILSLQDERRPITAVIDPWTFLKDDDARLSPEPLPESWDVTSDSIAARLAGLSHADELVLLKSALPDDVAQLGDYVDRYFAIAAKNLPAIRFVNLRDPTFPEVHYR